MAVNAVRVTRSAAALEADAAQLRAGKDELGKAAAGNVGIDVTTNEVVVALPADRKAALASKAAARGAKVVTAKQTPAELDAGCTSRLACDWTLRAGSIMWYGTTPQPDVVLDRLHRAKLEQHPLVTRRTAAWATA